MSGKMKVLKAEDLGTVSLTPTVDKERAEQRVMRQQKAFDAKEKKRIEKETKAATKTVSDLSQELLDRVKVAEGELAEATRYQQEHDERLKDAQMSQIAINVPLFQKYIKPENTNSFTDCQEADEFNLIVARKNMHATIAVNRILKSRPGYQQGDNINYKGPERFVAAWRNRYRSSFNDPSFRQQASIGWLIKRKKYAGLDYEQEDAPQLADKIALEEEIAKIIKIGDESGGIDISEYLGVGHKDSCPFCDNLWDGVSPTCEGGSVHLKWVAAKDHHFMVPHVVPREVAGECDIINEIINAD